MKTKLLLFLSFPIFSFCQSKIKNGIQDPQWSLFAANPLSANPAFTGESGGIRLMNSSRWQWFNFKGINSYSLALDSPVSDNLNAGFQLTRDNQMNVVSNQSGYFLFSLNFPEQSKIKRTAIQYGMKVGVSIQTINSDKNSIFADQIQVSSSQINTINSTDPLKGFSFSSFGTDASTGLIFKFIDKKAKNDLPLNWIGFSVDHFQKVFSDKPLIYPKCSFQYGRIKSYDRKAFYRGRGDQIGIEQTRSFTVNYYRQGPMSQMAMGWNYLSYPLIYGVWLRGDLIKSFKTQTREAVILITGYQQKKWQVQYALDLTTSSLSLSNTYGSHEISFWYNFDATIDVGKPELHRGRRLKCNRF